MDSKVNYTLVGAFVIGLSVVMICIGIWLSTQGRNQVYHEYWVYAEGGVDGLTAKSPVQFNGVKIGYVDSIDISPETPELVKLSLKIQDNVPITQSTTATLVPQGITGLVYVGLEAGKPASNVSLQPSPGQSYAVIQYKVPLLARISDVLPDITKNIQQATRSLTTVFSDQNNQALASILTNLAQISQTLANNSQQINKSLGSVQQILKNAQTASAKMDATFATINQAGQSLNAAGLQTTKTLQDGQLLFNNFNSQIFPSLYQSMQQLQQVGADLRDFSSQIAQNPAVLMRGKQAAHEGEGW